MRKKITAAIILGNAVSLLLAAVLMLYGSLQPLTYSLYDFDMKRAMTHEPNEDIMIVSIDDDSLKKLGTFPWDRDVYVPFLEKVKEAKAVAFDITFFTHSKNEQKDRLFAEALRKRSNVIIPSFAVTETELSSETKQSKTDMLHVFGMTKAIPEIAGAALTAHINRILDSDSSIRRTWLQIRQPDGAVMDSLALKAAKLYGADVSSFLKDNPRKEMDIKWNMNSGDFLEVPFVSVLNGDFPEENFQDRIVLLGISASGDDLGKTPVQKAMYLVYAHANIIDQLIKGIHLNKIGINSAENDQAGGIVLLITVLLLAVIGWSAWRLKPLISATLLLGLVLAFLGAQYFIFTHYRIYMDTVYPLAAMFISFLINIAIKTYFETKQKNYITRQFGRYISPDLVTQIARSGRDIQLGGINKELSVLFLDIRGFTALSERMKPEEVVDFLNMMFNMITEKALQNKGTIDKFIGDAAMILFNAPLDVPDHEFCAVQTGYDIQQGMVAIRKQIYDKYRIEVSIGIGIHTGQVVVGNIGSYLRVDYTAIGDNVNTAARIEASTTANQILVSEAVYERTKEQFAYQYIGEKIFKNKSLPVELYEVQGLADRARKSGGMKEESG